MNFSYANDSLWTVTLNEADIRDFHSPYLGNGTLGVRVAPTVFTDFENAHFVFVSKEAYDASVMLILPSFDCFDIRMNGIPYSLQTGTHDISQTLDLRTGVVSMTDRWTLPDGSGAELSARMLVSKAYSRLACLELSVKNAPKQSQVTFGIESEVTTKDPSHYDGIDVSLIGHHGCRSENGMEMQFSADNEALTGFYTGKADRRNYCQKVFFRTAGAGEAVNQITASHAVRTVTFDDSLTLTLSAYFGTAGEALDTCIRESRNCSFDALAASNRTAWKQLWDQALAFDAAGEDFAKEVLLDQFYLFQSFGGVAGPTGCLGLSFPGWNGAQLWDADLWMLRGLLPIAPSLARPIILYRRNALEKAKEHAEKYGLKGAWYPWQTDDLGRALNFPKEYLHELHNNIWIGLAPYVYYEETKDLDFLKETYPVMENICDFFCSWAKEDADGSWHIHDVIGPDECLAEVYATTVTDHFLTNVGVKALLTAAETAADLLSLPANPLWHTVKERLVIPKADENGIFPEYVGYNGHETKQADTIIAFYPLNYPCSDEQCMKNVDYYHKKAVRGAPLMTCQIEAILEMRCRGRETGLHNLIERFHEYVRGRYCIPYECKTNNNSIMLTGVGGLLQALICGYYDGHTFPRIGEKQSEE